MAVSYTHLPLQKRFLRLSVGLLLLWLAWIVNLIRQPDIRYPIEVSDPSVFLLGNAILDTKHFKLFAYVFLVESVYSCAAFTDKNQKNLINNAYIQLRCFLNATKILVQNNSGTPITLYLSLIHI